MIYIQAIVFVTLMIGLLIGLKKIAKPFKKINKENDKCF